MRQVPKYAVIGNGRMAKHIGYYLNYLGLSFFTWARSCDSLKTLNYILSNSTHVLLLINDVAIDDFIKNHIYQDYPQLKLVHFSGSLVSSYADSAHPLQTFAQNLYSFDQYKKIPFIIEQEGPEFFELLPGFCNSHYRIKRLDKPYYHALCVMANNFSTILWQKFFVEITNRFDIPQHEAHFFLDQTFRNIREDFSNALTGPFVRNDKKTLLNNLAALYGDDFFKIFSAFVEEFTGEVRHEKCS